jgi:hypothetical protein
MRIISYHLCDTDQLGHGPASRRGGLFEDQAPGTEEPSADARAASLVCSVWSWE